MLGGRSSSVSLLVIDSQTNVPQMIDKASGGRQLSALECALPNSFKQQLFQRPKKSIPASGRPFRQLAITLGLIFAAFSLLTCVGPRNCGEEERAQKGISARCAWISNTQVCLP
jgi:hypothetical protein